MTPYTYPMPLPEAGTWIYIPSSGCGTDRITGGKVEVKEVKHFSESIFLRICIPPTGEEVFYELTSLYRNGKQERLKAKFRETYAHIGLFDSPDIRFE